MSLSNLKQPFVAGPISTPIGILPQVSSSLTWADRFGAFKARWGIGRMHYTVEPGLYALGRPDEKSPVLVSANYKMSFDKLREALPGRDAWILVLDTKGINVWCASGKGTFGTIELVNRIQATGLDRVVSHRELILPQLSGPGVAAHLVRMLSGFKVIYGPIRAKDLPAFFENGLRATPEMRRKTFTTWERLVLVPIEIVGTLKPALIVLPILFLLAFLGRAGEGWIEAANHGLFSVGAMLVAILSGAVLTPLLLPWLPGRAFSLKGGIVGILAALTLLSSSWGNWGTAAGRLEILGWILLIPAVSAFLAMGFTGASTYTSLSGVKKEMRWALPLEIGGAVLGFALWIGSHFIARGV
ncbi:MAG: mercury methylation corrinoid protein HgcA [candidate division NC10 bacterium]|nr:mercury methylation corrinoid protein HgcA [candidate division NC10 bacterium]